MCTILLTLNPELLKIDYLKDKVHPLFVRDQRAMKQREYEEFKVRINGLFAKAQKIPEEGWIMQDGTLCPGDNTRDHPGMIQVFLGHSGGLDSAGNELPLVRSILDSSITKKLVPSFSESPLTEEIEARIGSG